MAAAKLLVGALPPDIWEEELRTVFRTYGDVTEIRILPEEGGARSAYVNYTKSDSGSDAIQVLDRQYKIRADAENPITVRWADDGASKDSRGWTGDGGGGRDWGDGGGGGGAGSKDDGFKIFVGGLPENISEEELQTVFGTYGEVMKIVIMKPQATTGLRGALVFYTRKESGEDAIKVLNEQYRIRQDAEKPIQVRWGKEDRRNEQPPSETGWKVFVGSLPEDISEDEMRKVFSTYGDVNQVVILGPSPQNNLRAALVFYNRREAAEDAIKVLNDVYKFREDAEKPIQVKWGKMDDKGKGGGKGYGGGKGGDSWSSSASSWNSGGGGGGGGGGWGGGGKDQGWQSLGDRNSGWQDKSSWQNNGWQDKSSGWQDSRSGWQDSRGGWQDRGGGGGGWQSGGGSWSGGRGGGKDGGKGGGKDGGKDGGKGWRDEGGYGKYNNPEPTGKLYVANLPEDIQDSALEYVFNTYGKVRSVHVMNGNSRNGAVAGFVELGSPDEAEVAIASLHDKYEIRPGFGPITVKHANNRPNRSRPY